MRLGKLQLGNPQATWVAVVSGVWVVDHVTAVTFLEEEGMVLCAVAARDRLQEAVVEAAVVAAAASVLTIEASICSTAKPASLLSSSTTLCPTLINCKESCINMINPESNRWD